MSDFAIAAELVIKQEGGLVDNPSDPGGLTNFGIALNRHPELTADDIRNMTEDRAKSIYQAGYWDVDWEALPQELANLLLSLSVNVGKVGATSIAQKALGVFVDGHWGPLTQGAAASTPNAAILVATQAIKYYESLNQPQFINGWVKRVLEVLCYAA